LQRQGEATKTVQEALGRKLDDFVLHNALYGIAFLNSDTRSMDVERRWFAEHSSAKTSVFHLIPIPRPMPAGWGKPGS
jgi:hypothetical protein